MALSGAQGDIRSPEPRLWAVGAAQHLAALRGSLSAAEDDLRALVDPATDPDLIRDLQVSIHRNLSLCADHALEARRLSHGTAL